MISIEMLQSMGKAANGYSFRMSRRKNRVVHHLYPDPADPENTSQSDFKHECEKFRANIFKNTSTRICLFEGKTRRRFSGPMSGLTGVYRYLWSFITLRRWMELPIYIPPIYLVSSTGISLQCDDTELR